MCVYIYIFPLEICRKKYIINERARAHSAADNLSITRSV